MSKSYDREKYWDEVAENITSRTDLRIIAGDDEPYYRYKRKKFLELLDSLNFKGKTVLEIGSGPGGNLEFIHNKDAAKITGVDISSQMVSLATKFLEGKNIDVIKINGVELPFENNAFDIVFTSTVLQHNTNEEDLFRLMDEICRVSNKEVYLFERIESRIKGHDTNLGRPVTYYADILKKNGFQLKRTKSLPIQASYYVSGMIRKIFNPTSRKEGEPLTKISLILENITLPVTSLLDKIIPSRRDVTLLLFEKTSSNTGSL
jgi:ubiquinone/menaquinone biosynthesis C-methylase UbiE